MLLYIYDKEVEEIHNDSNNAIAYIHDRDEPKSNYLYDYLYIEEEIPLEELEDESQEFEIEYDINDFTQ